MTDPKLKIFECIAAIGPKRKYLHVEYHPDFGVCFDIQTLTDFKLDPGAAKHLGKWLAETLP